MSGYGFQLTLVLIVVLINAAFAGSEMALVTLRESQLQRLDRESSGGQVLAKLARDPNRFPATIQIGITMAGFLASAAAAVSLAEPLIVPLGFLGSAAEPVAVVLVTVVLAFVTLVLGELAPKHVTMERAEGWALLVARPLNLLATVSRPAVWLLGKSTDLVVRHTGGDPHAAREESARRRSATWSPRNAVSPPSSAPSSAARSRSPTAPCARSLSRVAT